MTAPQLADTASAQPVFDHMKCFTIKDSLRGARYSVDLNALDPVNFPPQACTIKVPAKYLCVPTDKSNAVDVKTGGPPPGAPAGANPGDRLCYKVSCDDNRFRTSVQMTDQFGNRNVEARKTQIVCTPATRDGVPTPTPTGAATPTPTPVVTATPTPPPPTATPTPTPTPGSVVGAFLDGTTNF